MDLLAGLRLDTDRYLVRTELQQRTTVFVFEPAVGWPNFHFVTCLEAKWIAFVNREVSLYEGGFADPLHCIFALQRRRLWCRSSCFLVFHIEPHYPGVHFREFLFVEDFVGQRSF